MRGASRGRARRMMECIVGREESDSFGCGERWCWREDVEMNWAGLLDAAVAISRLGGGEK